MAACASRGAKQARTDFGKDGFVGSTASRGQTASRGRGRFPVFATCPVVMLAHSQTIADQGEKTHPGWRVGSSVVPDSGNLIFA